MNHSIPCELSVGDCSIRPIPVVDLAIEYLRHRATLTGEERAAILAVVKLVGVGLIAVHEPASPSFQELQKLYDRAAKLRGSNGVFPVCLTVDGGTDGDSTHAASWTYMALSPTEPYAFGRGLSPERRRPLGKRFAASLGLAYISRTGAFVLLEAYELPGTVAF
jgi:hypothetical protein